MFSSMYRLLVYVFLGKGTRYMGSSRNCYVNAMTPCLGCISVCDALRNNSVYSEGKIGSYGYSNSTSYNGVDVACTAVNGNVSTHRNNT